MKTPQRCPRCGKTEHMLVTEFHKTCTACGITWPHTAPVPAPEEENMKLRDFLSTTSGQNFLGKDKPASPEPPRCNCDGRKGGAGCPCPVHEPYEYESPTTPTGTGEGSELCESCKVHHPELCSNCRPCTDFAALRSQLAERDDSNNELTRANIRAVLNGEKAERDLATAQQELARRDKQDAETDDDLMKEVFELRDSLATAQAWIAHQAELLGKWRLWAEHADDCKCNSYGEGCTCGLNDIGNATALALAEPQSGEKGR